MKLEDYIKENSMSQNAFGRAIGVCHTTIGRYIKGERFPSRKILSRIYEVTGGQVTANDFYGQSCDDGTFMKEAA